MTTTEMNKETTTLDEIHTAIMQLSDAEYKNKDGFIWSDRCEFMCQLERIVLRDTKVDKCNFEFYNATAPQRREAFLRTIRLGSGGSDL